MTSSTTSSTSFDVDDVLKQLTLQEKAALASGRNYWFTVPVERLGVPSVVLSDGPHGLRRLPSGADTSFSGFGGSIPSTCFPPATALGSSWDPELVERVGHPLGDEARALDVQVLLGRGINIKR
ncbi:hypothetical protein [Streptomyces sp. NPDC048428]|uniref:hypothetical protein n=1 Tax=Streptomyces sp. NPDC048428 TaxID=3154503 RepID=UPI00343F4CB4